MSQVVAAKEKKDSKDSKAKKADVVTLKPIQRKLVRMRIVGKSPLILHAWAEKNRELMRDRHAGSKTKNRDVRDPQAEGEAAAYRKDDGRYGVPAMAVKASVIGAAHKDIGCEKTLVRKSLFILCDDDKLLPLECDEPQIREDIVRVGNGAADLRYRPYFFKWAVTVDWELDSELLQVKDLVTLVNRAGFGVGLCEWRPEKGGEYGRFSVDPSFPLQVTDLQD